LFLISDTMSWPFMRAPSLAAVATLVGSLAGCVIKQPTEKHFYDQHIQPILTTFCVGNTSPCHKVDPTTKTALGNLDLSSFDGVQKRRDVLRTYGSYPQPLLLLKALPEASVQISYQGTLVQSEIRHAGGKPIASNSDAYYELKRWLDNGANRDGIAPMPATRTGTGACLDAIRPETPIPDTTTPAYQTFVSTIWPFIQSSCAFGTCHGSPQADFYFTCGTTGQEMAFNYAQAAGFVAPAPTAVEQSEVLLRPLSPLAGGVSHTGGIFFTSRMDPMWLSIRDWALQVQQTPLPALTKTDGQNFFEANVMPKLLQRGCALEGCHSPDGFNDFRLRSGAQGFFAPLALQRNYQTLLTEFMAIDTVDIKQSRAVKKNIAATSGGITHRAGPLLEDMGSVDDPCPSPFDPTTNMRAICVFREWHRIERAAQLTNNAVSPMTAGSTVPLAFIARPPSSDDLLHFDHYQGQADLKLADATLDANGKVTAVGNVRSALAGCSGLAGQDADVRGPEWSYDGSKLVFAARVGAASGLDLWMLDVGAGTCTRLTSDNGGSGAVKLHNFDPVFAPDGSLVFASTRSGTITLKTFQPNSDLFRVGPSLDFGSVEQMTFLLNSELSPAFMQDGRVSFTAEKATPEFYQLSGRRINWDLTDYHPLLGQRAQSTNTFDSNLQPSIDYQQVTEIREGLDRNFLIILSDAQPQGGGGGGGALATFNRSIGPFQANRTEVTFVKSVVMIDPAATGRAGTVGVYRSPFSLPNGEILASYDPSVTDPTNASPRYGLYAVLDDGSGTKRMLLGDASQSYVEAALGYKRAERLLFNNLPQLVFGGHSGQDSGNDAVMHFPDGPVLATLLGFNLRQGRDVAAFDSAASLRVWKEAPPPNTNPGGLMGSQMVYSNRTLIGSAPFESDHSLKVFVPSKTPLILELVDGNGKSVFEMSEEHQVTPGEYITPGPPRAVFNPICGGCHGSLTGSELDVAVSPDALTGASVSASRDLVPKQLQQ
jgi:hypothetical protein